MNTKHFLRILCPIVMLAIGCTVQAQSLADLLPIDEAYKVTARISSPGVIKVHWTIAPEYYLYRNQMKFAAGDGVTLGAVQLPHGTKYFDQYLGEAEIYHNSVEVNIPYTLAPGLQRVSFSVRYQGCHEVAPKICYPPHSKTFDLPLSGNAAATSDQDGGMTNAADGNSGTSTSAVPGSRQSAGGAGVVSKPGANGLLAALLLALAGGLVLNLMPCVLPVLAVKAVGVLESGESRQRARVHALAYGVGVICSFLAIGIGILALRSAGHAVGWGTQMQQPVIVAMLACVLFAVGLSMSGVLQFGARLGNVGQNLTARGGVAGNFFTGVLAVVVATPCTAPFMGAALAYAFVAPATHELLVMLALGIGLALPLTLIGLVPALARLLPKPSRWMVTLKQLLAFPMYLAAVWLVWVLAQQRGADAAALVLVAMTLLGAAAWWHGRVGPRHLLGHAFTALLAAFALASIYAVAGIVPPARAAAAADGTVAFDPDRLQELRAAGTPVFVDMTADWCITCKANEHAVLDTAAFRALLKRTGTIYMVGDWTDVDPVIGAFLNKYHSPGVPLYVYFSKGGGEGKVLPTVLTSSLVRTALETDSGPAEPPTAEAQADSGNAKTAGVAKLQMEKLQSAIAAVDADPNSMQAHKALLKFEEDNLHYNNEGQMDSLSKEMESVLDKQYAKWEVRYPKSAEIQWAVGARLNRLEDPRTTQHILKYLDLDSANAKVHAKAHAKAFADLATFAQFREDQKAVTKYWHEALLLEPTNANYAVMYAASLPGTAALLDIARRFPRSEGASLALLYAADRAPDHAERTKLLQKALAELPNDQSGYFASQLYSVYFQDDPAKALSLAQQRLAAPGGSQTNWNWPERVKQVQAYLRAMQLVDTGNAKEAVQLLDELKVTNRLSADTATMVRFKARALIEAGQAGAAYKELLQQQAVAPDDKTAAALLRAGGLLGKTPQQTKSDLKTARYASAKSAPPFDLKEYGSDSSVSLAKLRGKVVFITYWYPGCGPCRAELPHLETVVKHFSKNDVAFLGINSKRLQASYVMPFVTNGRHIFIPLEATDDVVKAYGVRYNPANFIIDRDGRIVYSGFLIDNAHQEQVLHNMIKSLL